MANPFTTGPFNCCSCHEPPDYDAEVDDPLPTYVHLCGCPSVEVECASESKTATLCGIVEAPGFESTPPKKYRKLTASMSGTATIEYEAPSSCEGDANFQRVAQSGTTDLIYNVNTCVTSIDPVGWSADPSLGVHWLDYDYKCSGLCDPPSPPACLDSVTAGRVGNELNWFGDSISATVRTVDVILSSSSPSEITTTTKTLSEEDTEADAFARVTATTGTSCSSLYQLRTTSFRFTQRTVTYTATASNLVIGVQYEGCVRIRRREAYSGTVPPEADTEWYDVEPDTIAAFTPTATDEEVATDIALPNVQGYEYEVVGAYVWPVSAGCDCPTSYIAP
jgi:hypothetical protein